MESSSLSEPLHHLLLKSCVRQSLFIMFAVTPSAVGCILNAALFLMSRQKQSTNTNTRIIKTQELGKIKEKFALY